MDSIKPLYTAVASVTGGGVQPSQSPYVIIINQLFIAYIENPS
jgi:hypothetical protein